MANPTFRIPGFGGRPPCVLVSPVSAEVLRRVLRVSSQTDEGALFDAACALAGARNCTRENMATWAARAQQLLNDRFTSNPAEVNVSQIP